MSDNPKRIVLIDPVTETIFKTYESRHDIPNDLKINSVRHIADCLYHRTNQFSGYILKFEVDATPENIKIYSGKQIIGLNGERRCPICKKWFETLCHGHCNPCHIQQKKDYLSTKKGYFINLLCHMTTHSKEKHNKGRIEAGICNLDSQYLINMFDEQKGCCFYSGLDMTHIPTTDWQCSPERLDETKGYIDGNVKLICLEFNTGHVQWSKNKILQIRDLLNTVLDLDFFKKTINNINSSNSSKLKPRFRKKAIVFENKTLYNCLKCDEYLDIESFRIYNRNNKICIYRYCNSCDVIVKAEYNNSIRGFIANKLNSAQCHCKRISKNEARHKDNAKYELTLDIIIKK